MTPTGKSPFDELREFSQFWIDDGRNTPCCQFASESDVSEDPDMYQCGSCPVMDQVESLRSENLEAWNTFRRICTRLTVDGHAFGAVLAKLGEGVDVDEFLDLVTRLSILYDVYYPPKKPGKPHA